MIRQPRNIKKARNILLLFITIFSFFRHIPVYTQEIVSIIPDSLKNMSYEELRIGFQDNQNNFEIVKQYVKAFKEKSKKEKNSEKVAESFHLNSIIEKNFDKKILFLDSSINISKGFNHKEYPARAILYKAIIYENRFEYGPALENYTLALEYAKKINNLPLVYNIKYLIGLIKTNNGNYTSAKKLFKECERFYVENVDRRNYFYLYNIFALSEVSFRENKLDSCSYFNKIGLKESISCEKPEIQNYFILNESMVQFKRENYPYVIDSLKSVLPFLVQSEDYSNTIVSYYYLGKSYLEIDQKEEGIAYLLKMDSLFQEKPYFMYEERKGYDDIIEYYEKKKDLQKQLLYIKKTIKVDSFLNTQDKNLLREINLKYDTPILIQEKEKIIKKLNRKSKSFKTYIFYSSLLVFLSMVALIWNIRNNRSNRNKYLELIKRIEEKSKTEKSQERQAKKAISNDIFEVIRHRLENFKRDKKHRDKSITLNSLAKSFRTNSTYLSKFINQELNKTFPSYLNELRINDAVATLKSDVKIRKYKIQAISEYFGFNNAESFSKAFYTKTGIYPSYYIRELNKEDPSS